MVVGLITTGLLPLSNQSPRHELALPGVPVPVPWRVHEIPPGVHCKVDGESSVAVSCLPLAKVAESVQAHGHDGDGDACVTKD